MKKFFRELISDDNKINEQAFVGVVAFFAMAFILIVDVITGILVNELIIKENQVNSLFFFAILNPS